MEFPRLEPHTEYPDQGRSPWQYFFPTKRIMPVRFGQRKRKRPGFTPFRRRPFLVRPRFFSKKKKGFEPRWRKRAFAGRRRGLTGDKVARCIETKHKEDVWGASQSLAHTAGFDFQYIYDPMQFLVQGTNPENFNGECIWLIGIKLDMFFTMAVGVNSTWFIRIDCFKSDVPELNLSSATWTETNSAAAAAITQRDFQFYDIAYPPGDNSDLQSPRISNNFKSKHIMRKDIKLLPTNATAQQASRINIYLPLNQMFRWRTDTAGSLTSSGNRGVNGNYFFVLTFVTADHMSTGVAQPTPVIARGSRSYIYFKDP